MSLVPTNIHLSLKPISKDEWINDSQCNACYICTDVIKSSFIKSNKHHCRYCAGIICSKCSQNQLNRKRICDECIQNEILQQIKQYTSNNFIFICTSIQLTVKKQINQYTSKNFSVKDSQPPCPAVFIGNQIVFYKLQNKKKK
eukprot:388097_1